MGVLTKLTKDEVNSLIKDYDVEFEKIEETQSGITDSTYIGTSKEKIKYVFKVFENSNFEEIENNIKLLNSIKALKIAKVISKEVISYKTKPAILFSFIKGDIVYKVEDIYLKEIAYFLASLHNIKVETREENIFDKNYLEDMILKIENQSLKKELQEKYKKINHIKLKNNTLIHGDLFPDNTKFENKKLCGVFDFTQACKSDERFDLAVVIISWCFDGFEFRYDLFESFMQEYCKHTKKNLVNQIKNYCLYACLYYTSQRIIRKSKIEDCQEYLKKYEILEKRL